MSSPTPDGDTHLDAAYLGEPSPRRAAVAFALSLAAPGLGFAYNGRPGTAVAVNIVAVCLWVAFVVAWATLGFFPARPLLVFALGWGTLVLMCGVDAAREARRRGHDYLLRDANHPLVYLAIAAFTFILPLVGVHQWTRAQLWQTARVADQQMYPTLVAGDRILVDMDAFQTRAPERGDVVWYRAPGEDLAGRVGRILAGPGQEVAMSGDLVFIDDEPVGRRSLSIEEAQALRDMSGTPDEAWETAAEIITPFDEQPNLELHYRVATPRVRAENERPRTWVLGDDEFFILGDNRAVASDARAHGPVSRDAIVGRPIFVSYSVEQRAERPSELSLYLTARLGADAPFRNLRHGRRIHTPLLRR